MKSSAVWFALLVVVSSASTAAAEEGWIKLWDGKSLDGWKASEDSDSWTIEDGAIVAFKKGGDAKGRRSHLFYVGEQAPFKNFHFKCEVMTRPGANAGIYFHTQVAGVGLAEARL